MGARGGDVSPPGGGRFDEAGDATRRTRLANERTYLAWWRTGLTAFAVSLGTGKLVPALTDESRGPYVIVGIGFAVLGLAFVAYGVKRMRDVDAALARGEFARPDPRVMGVLAAVGIVLGIALIAIVAVGS
jgi:putative membrane protein